VKSPKALRERQKAREVRPHIPVALWSSRHLARAAFAI
jgi:hypothetical protein